MSTVFDRKGAIRRAVWRSMARAKIAPEERIRGAIPAFHGLDLAYQNLLAERVYTRAGVVYLDPDGPPWTLAASARAAGKVVVSHHGASLDDPFLVWPSPQSPPGEGSPSSALAESSGEPRSAAELPPIDLVFLGAVATDISGGRLGDGSGGGDRRYAVLRQAGAVSVKTPVVVLVHSTQLLTSPIPMSLHDVPVDLIITEGASLVTHSRHARPAGLYD